MVKGIDLIGPSLEEINQKNRGSPMIDSILALDRSIGDILSSDSC